MDLVYLECVKIAGKERVRIISPGYNNLANCQFPRDIRVDGRFYSILPSDITFAKGPSGKFFYRVKKNNIKIIEHNPLSGPIIPDKVYNSEHCIICFDSELYYILAPCGHFCLCKDCMPELRKTTDKCPICRGTVNCVVTQDMV